MHTDQHQSWNRKPWIVDSSVGLPAEALAGAILEDDGYCRWATESLGFPLLPRPDRP